MQISQERDSLLVTCTRYRRSEDRIMEKLYRILPEYYDLWGCTSDTCVITESDMLRLCEEYGITVYEAMEELEEED